MDLHLSVRLPVSLPCFSHSQTVILFCSVEPPCANSLLSSWRSSTTPDVKLQLQRRRLSTVSSALAETAASMAVAVTVVGAAATLLVKRSKTSESSQIQFKACEDCGGSGICSECKGEGFVLRKRSDESAEKARVQAKNMATRFTAGLAIQRNYLYQTSKEMELLHKVLFWSILFNLWWQWKAKLLV
ncbi:hypothetical protein GmHk_11G032293 [Glycine max]|uniref:uncharacterized protein isoform X1 n=1 Tax=Glycine max TaxID=3847 RepID=UPI0003DEA8E5|nr:uncharacterized protein LOC100779715 isoform X1 [Glycine max]KAH1225384.1 hypothetical protein GmHk_11G032293 [Glycine max]|eukprot:XP_006590282.1 uncharacterized protein LOC100779715 isoform X1 [Glycine max]